MRWQKCSALDSRRFQNAPVIVGTGNFLTLRAPSLMQRPAIFQRSENIFDRCRRPPDRQLLSICLAHATNF
jgi:hypothetical protein